MRKNSHNSNTERWCLVRTFSYNPFSFSIFHNKTKKARLCLFCWVLFFYISISFIAFVLIANGIRLGIGCNCLSGQGSFSFSSKFSCSSHIRSNICKLGQCKQSFFVIFKVGLCIFIKCTALKLL